MIPVAETGAQMQLAKKCLVILALICAGASGATMMAFWGTAAQAQQRSCYRCNIVDEGRYNSSIINTTVYSYDRRSNSFDPVTITGIHREGPYNVVRWYDPATGKSGKDLAENYYSYSRMMEVKGGGSAPGLTADEQNERKALWATCAIAESADNLIQRMLFLNSCCNSSAARKYGTPPGVC